MATLRLNERRVEALKPRKSTYDIRDRDLKGFGVRVLPSGIKRYFVHTQHQGRRIWRIVGDASAVGADEARSRARALVASVGKGYDEEAALAPDILFETVADEVFSRYARNWKPSTLNVNLGYYRKQNLPWFGGRPVSEITTHDVQCWFASLHDTPVAADRSAPVLSVIMRQAEVYGYRPEGSNPCVGIRRYRRKGRERFLKPDEIHRLGELLVRNEADHPQVVAIVRLLLLTGCRRGEIVTLRWQDIEGDTLKIADGKTGPRTAYLSAPARAILERQPRSGSAYVFPSPFDPGRPLWPGLPLWPKVRKETGIEDVRIHDLRHTVASHAVLQGIPLPAVSRLLGHKRPGVTLRYAHVGDRETEATAERIGPTIAQALDPQNLLLG